MKEYYLNPNYIVYKNGLIYSKLTNKFLKPLSNGNGYLKVCLYDNKKATQIYVHHLVAHTYIPNPNAYKYIDHIDRNKANNAVENLRWVTASQNTKNTANKMRYVASRKNPTRYTEEFKEKIKNEYISGLSVMEISRKYKIPRQSVSRFIK